VFAVRRIAKADQGARLHPLRVVRVQVRLQRLVTMLISDRYRNGEVGVVWACVFVLIMLTIGMGYSLAWLWATIRTWASN
jgi:hypothetical protein